MPTARASSAVIFPTVYASLGLPPAASAIAVGNDVPSSRRIAVPRSKSAPISSGSFDLDCSWFVSTAVVCLALDDAQRRSMRDVDESPDVQLVHVVHHLCVGIGIRGREAAVVCREENLADLLLQAHLQERCFGPFFLFSCGSARDDALCGAPFACRGFRGFRDS